ncbi:DUF2569 family protein [Bradyrhizobium sp. HKCCYLR20261]|uniref:DUF2569 family protein n=1 Tax=Bradyrhizobium sp. HKCCYLR20261 TaxID=3420760 RepID=UPI003EC0AA6A
MTDIWYYSEGNQPNGPVSLAKLISVLECLADPRPVLIWRQGFDKWKPVREVGEVAGQLFQRPPLQGSSAPSPETREPVVTAEEAIAFKNVRAQPHGIGGWLVLVAIGQVLGPIRYLISLADYVRSIRDEVWTRFPAMIWGEIALSLALLAFSAYTTILMFKHARSFPRFFIAEMLFTVVVPLLDVLAIAAILAISLDRAMTDFLSRESINAGQLAITAISAAIWIAYVLRSRRVANTFVK